MRETLLVNAGKIFKLPNNLGPGPQELLFGNAELGFFGEASSTDVTQGDMLAITFGLMQGTAMNSESPWLKFAYGGKILYTPKLPIRQGMSWTDLENLNLVTGEQGMSSNGTNYYIGLLESSDDNPSNIDQGFYKRGGHNSQWSKLFYPLIKDDPYIPSEIVNPLAPYEKDDLGFGPSITGTGAWCKEIHRLGRPYFTIRGNNESSTYSSFGTSNTAKWRPVLELIV